MLENIQFKNLLKYDYWFSIDRVSLHNIDKAFLYMGAVLVVLGVILLVWKAFQKNELLKPKISTIGKILLTIGALEMLWFLLRIEFVNFLGTRFIAVLILIIGLIYLFWPVKYLLFNLRADLVESHKRQIKEKYLQQKA